MVSLTLINGNTSHRAANGVNGASKANAATPPTQTYDYDSSKLTYLDNYTIDDVLNARSLSDPYANLPPEVALPPFARPIPIALDSFRPGYQPTLDELASEVTTSYQSQMPLAAILDKFVQDAYGNLSELAEVYVARSMDPFAPCLIAPP